MKSFRNEGMVCLVVVAVVLLNLGPLHGKKAFPGYRSPGLSFTLAALPGFALHGLGNYHAGKRKRAGILFAAELFGLGLMAADSKGKGLSGVLAGEGGETGLGMAGRVLFFGSYAFDVMTAHEAAEGTNLRIRKERASKGIELMPIPSPRKNRRFGYPGVGVTRRF